MIEIGSVQRGRPYAISGDCAAAPTVVIRLIAGRRVLRLMATAGFDDIEAWKTDKSRATRQASTSSSFLQKSFARAGFVSYIYL